jgi:transaldolase
MNNNPLQKIQDCGQSIWMDYLDREVIESGQLKEMIETYGISGVTSNPAIFEKAIADNKIYDADIEAGIREGKSVEEIYESLVFEDIRNACDILRPVYEKSEGKNGYVSIEVSPHLARDSQGTIEEARRFFQTIGRDNVMIKIPGTAEGLMAIKQVISEGINVNVTLLFAVKSYVKAAWAYIEGLEARVEAGKPINNIASVASFFVSRIDTKVDKLVDQRLNNIGPENVSIQNPLAEMKGKIAIANAKVAYQKHKEIIHNERWQALEKEGGKGQRLLWASTSTKNPNYSDVMYVDELIGPYTVNTLPIKTIKACADHCQPAPNRIETDLNHAYRLVASLGRPDVNIDLQEVMAELLEEGIDKFVQPFDSLMQSLESKVKELAPA